jgi:hypothetical protein
VTASSLKVHLWGSGIFSYAGRWAVADSFDELTPEREIPLNPLSESLKIPYPSAPTWERPNTGIKTLQTAEYRTRNIEYRSDTFMILRFLVLLFDIQ